MPFLSPPDVLPEAVRFVIRALLAHDDPVPHDELVRLVGPRGAVEALGGRPWAGDDEPAPRGRLIAERTVAAMAGVDLVAIARGGERAVTLADRVRERFPSWRAVEPTSLAEWLTTDLFGGGDPTPEAGGRGWIVGEDPSEAPGVRDLALALALLFHRPAPLVPLAAFESGPGSLNELQTEWFGPDNDGWVVRNKERYGPLTWWTAYLGLARDLGRTGLLLDASAGLRQHVVAVVGDGEVLVEDLVATLGHRLSFTDRGWAGLAVADLLDVPPPEEELSPALALALSVLAADGVITLSQKSDAAALVFPVSATERPVYSHAGPGKDGSR